MLELIPCNYSRVLSGLINCQWWLIRVTLVVAFGFLPQNFGRWWGPTNDGFAQK